MTARRTLEAVSDPAAFDILACMPDLETRELRYFVAVAEELHFGRAAERLGIAQPALSRAIRTMERHLETELFERTTRQVSMTAAGEVLLQDARGVLDAVAAAGQRARHAGRTEPLLRVALKADYDGGLLPAVLHAFEQDAASTAVDLVLGGRGEQVAAIREGRADVALLPTPFDPAGLDHEPLLTERRVLALADGDPLVAMPVIRLADLDARTLPDGTPASEGITAAAAASWESIGLPVPSEGPAPTSRRGELDLAQIFSLVELGRVVLFVPESVADRHARPGLSFREVHDLPPTTLTVAWPEDSQSRSVAAFVRAATQVAARSGAGDPVGHLTSVAP